MKFNIITKLQSWMDSQNGATFLHYAYNWGASIVILGTLFKLTHMDGADIMLWIGLGTEVLVFFISGFDHPYGKEQHLSSSTASVQERPDRKDRGKVDASENMKAEQPSSESTSKMKDPPTNTIDSQQTIVILMSTFITLNAIFKAANEMLEKQLNVGTQQNKDTKEHAEEKRKEGR